MKKHILLVGNYGHTNIGDEMLKLSALKLLDKNAHNVKTMGPQGCDFPIFTIGIRSTINNFSNNFRALFAIFNAKKVVFGGGGLFNSQNSHAMLIWGSILFVAVILRKEVDLLGQSFSSVPGLFFKLLLNSCNYISVRDKQSYDFLNKASINSALEPDLALLLNSQQIESVFSSFELSKANSTIPDNYILFNARFYKSLNKEVYADIKNWIITSNKNIVFVPFDSSDIDFYNRYLSNLGVFIANASLELFTNAEFACGMRLHFLLVAKKLGKKITPLSYAPKVIGMFGDANCIDLYNYNKQKNPLL